MLATSLAGALTATAASASTDDPIEYVALGDSYASGYGLGAYATGDAAGCLRSAKDYPHKVALAYGWKLTDATCGGAVIGNVADTPQATPSGSVAAQSGALSASTDVVTISIGGNDLGFSTVLGTCFASSPSGPLMLDPSAKDCKTGSAAAAALPGLLTTQVAPAFDAMLTTVQSKAPNAKIFVVGYPTIFPSTAVTAARACFVSPIGTGQAPLANAYPFTSADVAYFHDLQASLDTMQRQAAEKHKATFVPMLSLTDATSPCAGNPNAQINGVTFTSLQPPTLLPGTLHPNDSGSTYQSTQVGAAIERTGVASHPSNGLSGHNPGRH